MTFDRYLRAAMLGLAVSLASVTQSGAQSLTIMQGEVSSALQVSMNRAVVVEAETPFAELSIANPGIADISTLSDRTIYVLGKAPGRTTLTLLGPDGRLITNVEVQVTPDVAEFKERLRQILPGEGIEVRTANDGIVLSGVVSSIERLDRALDLANRYAPDRVSNLMVVGGTQQVMLKVRFAEVQRRIVKDLSAGLNILQAGSDASISAAAGSGALVPGTSIGGAGSTVLNVDDAASEGQFAIGFDVGSVGFAVLLEALEQRNLVRTLSEPNLTALSGQEATFLAGGEYPIPVVDDDGGVTVEYKPFGVQLNFVPRVIDGNRINLELNAAVSAIDTGTSVTNSGFSVNAFTRRETTTTVEMMDGQSFAIAGLLEDDFSDAAAQVPWLGDLPVLGALFRSANYEREQSELVVIITPHLVAPTRGEALALPTDRIRIPTEAELFLFGQTARPAGSPRTGAEAEVAKQDFGGSYGYVME
ncbi:MAG: type II and III secretion system protein family protein [Boseongicola sp.]|nr:type II and III secretion system protein family protein [Boseongicola sp.]MDD9979457.1 type II and III secretion system protein family protein [Boseongicola sp.]